LSRGCACRIYLVCTSMFRAGADRYTVENIKTIFRQQDLDGLGTISSDRLCDALTEIGVRVEDLNSLLLLYDKRNADIKYDCFIDWVFGRELDTLAAVPEWSFVTWNIAAINNNPFEYYATLEDEAGYEELMRAVQDFIDDPRERDVPVSEVFTPAMFETLADVMTELGWEGVDKVRLMWSEDFSKRKMISEFLKDKEIGSKRLASMPDRFTNTINNTDGRVMCRPTVINNYHVEMADLEAWFKQWFDFMFCTDVCVRDKKGNCEPKKVCSLLQPIKRAKYPAVTEEEEAVSVPLQTLALGIFDAILVHILNSCAASAPGGAIDWHQLKVKLCDALVVNKQRNVINILAEQPAYCNADVIFLQECAGAFIEAFRNNEKLNSKFWLLVPKTADHCRDQNSLILVSKAILEDASAAEELDLSGETLGNVRVADGDICAFTVPLQVPGQQESRRVLLVSFHGDTAGLSSTPVLSAVRKLAADAGLPVVIGIDANTYAHKDPKGEKKYVQSFLADLEEGPSPLAHSWSGSDTTSWHTTFNARTFLQPQLNKAVRFEERHTSKLTDNHPKDWILFSDSAFEVVEAAVKDNTGQLAFKDGVDFPTLTFPSDHAVVSTTLRVRRDGGE